MYKVEVEEGGAALDNTAVSGLREVKVIDSTFYFLEVLNTGGKKKWQ